MGWYQTGKASFWRHGAYDEFMGLKDGFFCMIKDWRGRIYLHVYFLREGKSRSKEIAAIIKKQRRIWGCGGATARGSEVTLVFGGFSQLFRSKKNRMANIKSSLEAVVPLLRSMGVRPMAVCECRRQDQLVCLKESNGALHFRCKECAAKLKTALENDSLIR